MSTDPKKTDEVKDAELEEVSGGARPGNIQGVDSDQADSGQSTSVPTPDPRRVPTPEKF